jgi:endo-1,4-beta-mannosidase
MRDCQAVCSLAEMQLHSWRKRAAIAAAFALLCACLLGGCALLPRFGAAPAAGPKHFVEENGTGLSVGGQAYRFEGMDIYMAASRGECGGSVNLGRVLDEIGPEQNVFRVWLFQPFVVSHGHFVWGTFNRLLEAANRHHERVIVTLGNEWNYCDGPQKDLAWWQGGYKTSIGPGDIVPYREWVADVVSRYRSDKTIAMWQLVNEGMAAISPGTCNEAAALAAMRSFAEDVGGLVKSISHQLVSLGDIPGYCGDSGPDYQTLNAVPTIDVCDYHDYGPPGQPLGSGGVNGLDAAITACHADDKPIMVAESGIAVESPTQLKERAQAFRAKFVAQFAAGVVGELLWSWVNASTYVQPETPEDYGIGPGDPSLRVLGTF